MTTRVALISDLESRGGAAIAATRLAASLAERGVEIVRIVFSRDDGIHPWATIDLKPGLVAATVARQLRHRVRNRFAEKRASLELTRILEEIRPDFVNLHNLHNAAAFGWSPDFLRVSARIAPSVWTLHDMWSFTGRCAYSYECRKFLTLCDSSCPTPNEYPALNPLQISGAWRYRQEIFSSCHDVAAAAPSAWIGGEAKAGLWKEHRVEHIPNGLPLDVYRPMERDRARRLLGLPPEGPHILLASQLLSERRKGGHLLKDIFRTINMSGVSVITLGETSHSIDFLPASKMHSLGFVDDPTTVVAAYNAADLLLHPAPVDNLPNVVMEAIACGTPVVAFETGGVGEMVRPGLSGWLAKSLSSGSLGKTLEHALKELEDGIDLRSHCRQLAEREYDINLQAQRYVDLFQSMQ